MVRKMCFLVIFVLSLNANKNIYESNCLSCHKELSFSLEKIYFRYLLKYSDEVSVKLALIDFLKDPNSYTSVLPKEYIKSFGLKQKTTLSEEELEEAVDIYWEKYTVSGKIK